MDAEMVEFIYPLNKYLLRFHAVPDSAVGPGNSCLQCFGTGVLADGDRQHRLSEMTQHIISEKIEESQEGVQRQQSIFQLCQMTKHKRNSSQEAPQMPNKWA